MTEIVDLADACPQCGLSWRIHPTADDQGRDYEGRVVADPGEAYCIMSFPEGRLVRFPRALGRLLRRRP